MAGGRRRWRVVVLVVVGVLLVVGVIIGVRVWGSVSQVAAGGGMTEPVDGRYTVVLMGSDSAEWRDGARVDSTMVVSVDAVTGRSLVVSIPRNLVLIPFPVGSPLHELYPDGFVCPNQETAPCMLTMVYQLGLDHAGLFPDGVDAGAEAMVDAVEAITGLTVNYYAFIDMDGFEALVDAVGGVEVELKARIPIGASGATFYWVEPGLTRMSGEEALWYVRSRVDTDDYTRMTRQKCVLMALAEQVDPGTVVTRFIQVADAAAQTAHTNIPVSEVPGLADLAGKAMSWTVSGLSLTPPLIDPLNPDYTQIRNLIAQAITDVEALDTGTSTTEDTTLTDITSTCGY